MCIVRTRGRLVSDQQNTQDWSGRTGSDTQAVSPESLYAEAFEAHPVPSAILDPAGIVLSANQALCDLLQSTHDAVVGEPVLGWMGRAAQRAAFGRAFRTLRDREVGSAFSLDLSIDGGLGTGIPCIVRAHRLRSGFVFFTADKATASGVDDELGTAITRSLDALDQGVLLIEPQGRIVRANPAAAKILGTDITGHSFLELVDPDEVDGLGRALAMAHAGSWQGEMDLRRLDGEPVPVELSMAAGPGEGAPAVVLIGDLRERRRREFEDRLVALVDRRLVASAEPHSSVMGACAALAGGMGAKEVVVAVRLRGAWERWSVRAEGGAHRVERLEAGVEPPATWSDLRDVDVVDLAAPEVERVFGPARGGAGARIALRAPIGVVGHLLLLLPDAAQLDARNRALLGVLASQIAFGLANGLLTLEARALAAYQAMVLDQSSVMLNSVDADGRVLTWNRASADILGIPVMDAMGQTFGTEVARARDPAHWDALWSTVHREGVAVRQLTVLAADGTEVPVHLEARLVRDEEAVRGAVLVGLDLRERRELERQVLTSQKLAAVGLLAAGIAHELNNPLTGVVGYSTLLLERDDLADHIRQKVEKISASAERCRKIVEGVLLFSRQQEGGVRRRLDLRTLIDRVVAIGEYQWRMHNVRIILEMAESVHVLADGDQLEQVLLNLLSNAVDAMPRGGTVRVGLHRHEDGAAHLTVADQGHGIPPEIQARIFDPFFSTKEIGKGTGLGLAISYGIVQDHGGDILLESTAGQGSTFTVILPPDGEPRPGRSEPGGGDDPRPTTESV